MGVQGGRCQSLDEGLGLLRCHVPSHADQEREDHAADRAATNIADPAFDGLADERADQLADNAAADRARDCVAQRSERILIGRGASRAAANCARHDLHKKTCEIHLLFLPVVAQMLKVRSPKVHECSVAQLKGAGLLAREVRARGVQAGGVIKGSGGLRGSVAPEPPGGTGEAVAHSLFTEDTLCKE